MKGKRTHMKAVALVFMLLGMATMGWAQQRSTVDEKEVDINGIVRKGQRIMIQLDNKVVEKAWASYLKEKSGGTVKGPSILPTAKAQAGKGVYTVEKAQIDTITTNPMRIMSKVEGSDQGTMVWWSLDLGNAYLSKKETTKEWARSEALLQQFARQLYKQDVQNQIADAEKVLVNSQNEADRVVRQADEIKYKITKNQARKQELEAELAANANELTQLNQDVENNLKQQEAAKKQVENMRRAVDIVKAKMDKII
ncbi:DNA repair ATPase [Nibribacter koreensis]|uniref:DNA repair ATPase n=1 Tax=Nibribacter koreensis TaxID=1084519 RepID=A0ABP8FJA5_9BACT